MFRPQPSPPWVLCSSPAAQCLLSKLAVDCLRVFSSPQKWTVFHQGPCVCHIWPSNTRVLLPLAWHSRKKSDSVSPRLSLGVLSNSAHGAEPGLFFILPPPPKQLHLLQISPPTAGARHTQSDFIPKGRVTKHQKRGRGVGCPSDTSQCAHPAHARSSCLPDSPPHRSTRTITVP